ncbi:hypothetical protein [Vibrio sp. CAU 1672]|uniref:hypothetical protein n=1 Tax=Vibrio sp. CAU 1672 TaxID=3032594 RepID=UPI0023D97FCD|nr:hypothetical protein [Vibrio sp. CAU 1672]MDF2155339.1 hypothetical protein [Vibrio sp. CAU 1672]
MKLDMNSGNAPQPAESQEHESVKRSVAEKLKAAYIRERTKLEITEVELNRSKVMMIDENGNMKRVPILSEH